MALRCAVPNCGSRYKKDQGILIYPFPENEIIKFKWILKIPRQRRDIGPETGVCSLHFLQRDINSDNELLAHAIPSVFENLSPKKHLLNSLFDLVEQINTDSSFIPPNVLKLSKPQYIVFYKVHFDPKSIAEMEFTLYIHNDLTFNVYHKFSDLKNIPLPNYKFFNLTEIRDLLFALNSIQYSPSSEELSLKKPIELIRGVDCESMEERLKVDFLLEQLEMLSCAPHERQFSLNTLTSANIWKNRCSTVYEMLCNYLTLPDICLDDIQDEVRDFSRSYLKGARFSDNDKFKEEMANKISRDSFPYGDLIGETFQKLWVGDIEEYETELCLIAFVLLNELCAFHVGSSSENYEMEVIPSPEDCEEKEVKEEKGNCVDSLISEGDYNNDCKEPIVLDDDEDYIPPNKKESNNHLPPDISFECCFCQTVIYTQDDVFIHCKSMHVGRAVVIKVKDGPAIKYMGSLTEFTCGECRKEIHSVNDLNNHIAGHIIDYKHRKTKPKESRLKNQYRSCLMCSCVFETFFALKKHNEIEHPSEGSLYECQKCGEVFNQCSTYLRHKMYSHTKKREKSIKVHKCVTCHKVFRFKSSLDKHNINVHKSQPYVCTLCGKQFGKDRYLVKHKARVHPQSLDFVCNICGKKCATNEYLRYHIKVRHSESLPYSKHSNNPEKYQCHLCDKSYMNKTFLTNHIDVIHNGLKLFCCQICGKTCSSAHNLKLHENLHEESKEKCICEFCGNEFSSKLTLRHHTALIHKDQEELKLLECEECGKTFRISKDLRAHIKVVHKQIKDFKCDICDKAFSFRTHLKRHKQTIHDESCEYKCHVCSVLFFQKPSLRKHLEKVHNINSTTSSNSL